MITNTTWGYFRSGGQQPDASPPRTRGAPYSKNRWLDQTGWFSCNVVQAILSTCEHWQVTERQIALRIDRHLFANCRQSFIWPIGLRRNDDQSKHDDMIQGNPGAVHGIHVKEVPLSFKKGFWPWFGLNFEIIFDNACLQWGCGWAWGRGRDRPWTGHPSIEGQIIIIIFFKSPIDNSVWNEPIGTWIESTPQSQRKWFTASKESASISIAGQPRRRRESTWVKTNGRGRCLSHPQLHIHNSPRALSLSFFFFFFSTLAAILTNNVCRVNKTFIAGCKIRPS